MAIDYWYCRIVTCIFMVTLCLPIKIQAEPGRLAEEGPTRRTTLVLGRISDNPKKHFKMLKPIVDYVAAQMADIGILTGKVVLANNNRQMSQFISDGVVDWVTETPFSALLLAEETGADIILRRWKDGVANYRTVFITLKDSPIKTLKDLLGRKIAFEDKGSTSAFHVPAASLIQEGIAIVQLPSLRSAPVIGKVGFVFANGEVNAVTWVFRGLVDAAAYSNIDWLVAKRTPETMRHSLRIFHETEQFPRAMELVRRGLTANVKDRLIEILLNAHNDDAAQPALTAYTRTKRFDLINGYSDIQLKEARDLLPLIKQILQL